MAYSVTTPSNRVSLYSSGLEPVFGRLFDQAFRDFFAAGDSPEQSLRKLTMDVSETDKGYLVHADLPGIEKDAVKIQIDGPRVTISAETRKTDEKSEGGKVIYRERSSSQFYRSFELPAEIDATAAEAKLENGVLTLNLPRKAQATTQQITVK
ncbi:Hsp20/alpha crystallin family protein [Thiomonas bhubaneswarensis]|uniref:Heat shock protein Hsp20 n=1 Tax=Thiomonas bhubaneswarensis TaxID=339866 RepID=A0A0K6I4E0_9BURK|nr:Hsp20/alpha crystallin family protein [Thiomonas bhubaneswarensis]CUA98000.1 heat shock protein Hsp20 [Thiomonas bhubaneswarensis]